ncbi:MAG: hypothetical protein AAGU19_01285 [Prolixibacteraceae bacterium]
MSEGYVLEWLDDLITVRLNPAKTNIGTIQTHDVANFQRHIADEKRKIVGRIQRLVFSMQNEINIRSGIKLYHTSLISLLDQATENQIHYVKDHELKELYDELIACIDELILFIENRYPFYLDAHERLPSSHSSRVKNELSNRISRISDTLHRYPDFQPVSDILLQTLLNYSDLQAKQHSFTSRDVEYIKELCDEIGKIATSGKNSIFTALDERLIYMNFNHRMYVDEIIQRVANDIYAHDSVEDQILKLLLHYKSFKQLQRKPNTVFNPKSQDIYGIINNWFRHECSYLEKIIKISAKPHLLLSKFPEQKNPPDKAISKITCSLSSDQIALLIRAAAELEILIGKSLNNVFKAIIPHVSTPYRTDLSPDGVRSKAYVGEQRDKEIVIEILYRIIKRIEEY